MERKVELTYDYYASPDELSGEDMELVIAARQAAHRSFAIYSNFSVGAAARLESGVVVSAANVESEVYPSGICAERNLLFNAATSYPTDPIKALAIVSTSTSDECYPCGMCRQVLVDTERRQGGKIRVIMAGDRTATAVESAHMLLPFTFVLP